MCKITRFTIEAFENVGKALLVSILDIFEKNPYSRIPNTPYKSIDNIRKEIAMATTKIDRFRKEGNAKKKANVHTKQGPQTELPVPPGHYLSLTQDVTGPQKVWSKGPPARMALN